MNNSFTWTFIAFLTHIHLWLAVNGNPDARRLYDDLLRKNKYNRLIRPVSDSQDKLEIVLSIKLSQIMDVDEKNEIITLNMWLRQEWVDSSLKWEPAHYGGVDMIYVPAESIWIPDLVLYNNADGDYIITLMTKATIISNGSVTWEPPAIYKSYCNIKVDYFPFDEQKCHLKFGIWTYDGLKVDLRHKDNLLNDGSEVNPGMQLTEYYKSIEWDLMKTEAVKSNFTYPCCSEPYPDVTFYLEIRRKTLYYAINLIIPCVSINMLTILTFYLPADCGEKVSVCISILLSLSLFQLLLMELVPGTSLVTPLLGKYLLFTCMVVSASVMSTVLVLNLTHRSSNTYKMPKWVERFFIQILPRLLFIERPQECSLVDSTDVDFSMSYSEFLPHGNPYKKTYAPTRASVESVRDIYGREIDSETGGELRNVPVPCELCARRRMQRFPPNVHRALEGIAFAANHIRSADEGRRMKDKWQYLARVVDRLLLFVYIGVCFLGALAILMNAQTLYDGRKPLPDGIS